MIGMVGFVIIGVLLLLMSILMWTKARLGVRELPPRWDFAPNDLQNQVQPCPPEMVLKIFSRSDQQFVSSLRCSFLEKLFRAERKALALLWVQQTYCGIQKIMENHTELTRRSADLEFLTEMKLFFQYAELRFVCGFLLLSIELAGPFWWRGLALYTSDLTQRLGRAHDAILAATEGREIRSLDSY